MNLNIIFGLKLKQLRSQRGYSLKELSERSQLSPSYLNEIEKGKKYPKSDKILLLAEALGVSYDDLVSTQLTDDLNPLSELLKNGILSDLPLELFGIEEGNLVDIMSGAPSKFSSLIETLIEIGRNFDLKVEDFLFAALRTYQERHHNFFAEIEFSADRFRADHTFEDAPTLTVSQLKDILTNRFGYKLNLSSLLEFPELREFRSVFKPGKTPTLWVNDHLLPSQIKFVLAKEIGFNILGLKKRPSTSTWIDVESFEQVLNNFKASYFAGSLLLNRHFLAQDIRRFVSQPHFDGAKFLSLMHSYEATPEMFQHRISQLSFQHFGFEEIYFLRFNHIIGANEYHITKELHLTGLHNPHRSEKREHYCRRWISIDVLQDLEAKITNNKYDAPVVGAQFSRYVDSDETYFNLAVARPLQLQDNRLSCVTLGFKVNDHFREKVKFLHDPNLKTKLVGHTCQRCGIKDCEERAGEPIIFNKMELNKVKREKLARLLKNG